MIMRAFMYSDTQSYRRTPRSMTRYTAPWSVVTGNANCCDADDDRGRLIQGKTSTPAHTGRTAIDTSTHEVKKLAR